MKKLLKYVVAPLLIGMGVLFGSVAFVFVAIAAFFTNIGIELTED